MTAAYLTSTPRAPLQTRLHTRLLVTYEKKRPLFTPISLLLHDCVYFLASHAIEPITMPNFVWHIYLLTAIR